MTEQETINWNEHTWDPLERPCPECGGVIASNGTINACVQTHCDYRSDINE